MKRIDSPRLICYIPAEIPLKGDNSLATVTVRLATAIDGPIIAKFNALMALETEHRTLEHDTLRWGVESVLADPSKGKYFVAESGGGIVGQMLITYEWSDWRDGTFWWIQSVYVKEGHRGKGVFKAMFKHIEDLSRSDHGVCGLRLYVEHHNEQAKRTYEKLGMKKTHYELYEIDYVLR